MKSIGETISVCYGKFPEKIIQMGEGNFLRAFADWMADLSNEQGDLQGSILLCQPISFNEQMRDRFAEQNGAYTLIMRGIDEEGKPTEKVRQITSVSRCINVYKDFQKFLEAARNLELKVCISNTTEAGIAYKEGDQLTDVPPTSFPAKMTVFLYERYKAFKGATDKGLLFLPVELIDYNGTELRKIILRYSQEWKLPTEFIDWVGKYNYFTNTLVDRIVTGYPKEEASALQEKLGYQDNLMVTSELFNLWVIEGKKEWAEYFPVHKTKANVIWTDDVRPYKMRKVRILNGGHTATVLAAYLAGHNIVLDFMNDPVFVKYLDKLLFDEVIPTLDLPEQELKDFAVAVKARFANPYIKHRLLDISLNSCSKYAARCLPSLTEYFQRKGTLPELLSFSLAAFIKFYQGKMKDGKYMGNRFDGTVYEIRDDQVVLEFFAQAWQETDMMRLAQRVLSSTALWSVPPADITGLTEKVAFFLEQMQMRPIKDVVTDLVK